MSTHGKPVKRKPPAKTSAQRSKAKAENTAPSVKPNQNRKSVNTRASIRKRSNRSGKASERKPSRARRVVLIVFSAIALIAALFAIDSIRCLGKIHSGVSVGGVDVGGKSIEEACALIEQEYTPILDSAYVVVFADDGAMSSFDEQTGFVAAQAGQTATSWEVTAQTLGAKVDGQALAKDAYECTRGTSGLANLLKSIFGGVERQAYISCDFESFHGLVDNINAAIGTYPVNADVEITDGKVSVTSPSNGSLVDEQAFLTSISNSMLAGAGNFVVTTHEVDYVIDEQSAQAVADDLSSRMIDGVQIEYLGQTWDLNRADIGNMISTDISNPNTAPSLVASVDVDKVRETLDAVMGDVAAIVGAQDARFDTSSGSVTIVPSVNGIGPDYDRVTERLQQIIFGSGESSSLITIYQTEVLPELTTEEAEQMGIRDLLSYYDMSNEGSSYAKLVNMHVACETLSYVLIAPGESFSWNDYVGDTTEDKGYQEGVAVVSGEFQSSIGGGICQVATTMFNAVYEAGLQVDERHNHSMYIASYPEGRDATISYGNYDFKWTNDSGNWILMEMYSGLDGGVIYCQLWGTSTARSVTTDYGQWEEGDEYTVKYVDDPTQESGSSYVYQYGDDGRSISIVRHVFDSSGTEIRTDTFDSYYSPKTEIVMVGSG